MEGSLPVLELNSLKNNELHYDTNTDLTEKRN